MSVRLLTRAALQSAAFLVGLVLAGCANGLPSSSAPIAAAIPTEAAPAARPAPPPITQFPLLDLDDAVLAAADALLAKAAAGHGPTGAAAGGSAAIMSRPLTIDPLIDGLTAQRLVATRSMQARIGELIRDRYPQFEVQPFRAATLTAAPLVLIGTLTAIDAEGRPGAAAHAYRVWLTLVDLRSGTIVAKSRARARPATVDAMPTQAFRDSPVWGQDDAVDAYIATCHGGTVGGPVPPEYLDRLLAAALTSDAIEAYEAGRYQEALETYTTVRGMPDGDQLRVLNGLYLANWKLGRPVDAAAAFGDIVDYGLKKRQLSVKFLFRPGSTAFWPDPEVSGAYPIWLREIARRTAARADVCIEVAGHSSRTGPEPLNERLSLLRAEAIKRRLEAEEPALSPRTIASGMGSRENLIGTGTDDAIDALDRRVEFKLPPC